MEAKEEAKQFLRDKKLMIGDAKDYEARYRKQEVIDGKRTATFPELDLVSLLVEYRQKDSIEDIIKELPVGEYAISPPMQAHHEKWIIHTNDNDFEGSTLTEALTNYRNFLTSPNIKQQ